MLLVLVYSHHSRNRLLRYLKVHQMNNNNNSCPRRPLHTHVAVLPQAEASAVFPVFGHLLSLDSLSLIVVVYIRPTHGKGKKSRKVP